MWMGVLMWMAAIPAGVPVVFLSESDLTDARGVGVAAQVSEDRMTLVPKDAGRAALWYAPVASEQEEKGARIWYQRIDKQEAVYEDQRVLCVARVSSGQWSPVPVSGTPPAWGGVNNVVLRRSPHKPTWGGFNVFQILSGESGYAMLYWDQPETGEAGGMLARSKDGLHWEKDPGGAVFTEHNDAFSLLRQGSEHVLYQTKLEDWPDKPHADNLDKFRRVIARRSSPDLVQWTAQEVFLRPDAEDAPDTEFYLMKAFAYGGGYAGLILKYYADPAAPGKHSALYQHELIVSRDARQWERPFRRVDLGFFSYADPFLDADRLCFVYWKDNGIDMVRYRPQGLTAVVAEQEGGFTTAALPFDSPDLTLNADIRGGWLEADLLAGYGSVYSAPRIENQDGCALPLRFSGLKNGAAGPFRLRFRMQHAKLYSVGS